MSYFFDVSDSDESLNEVVITNQNEETNVAQIHPKWFEVTDEEDANEKDIVLSRNEKSLNEIQNKCDLFSFHVDRQSWSSAEKEFQELQQKVVLHTEKFKVIPWAFLECIRNTDDLNHFVVEMEKIKAEKEELLIEKKVEKNKEDNFYGLKRLVKVFQKASEVYRDAIDRLDDEESDEESKDDQQKDAKDRTEEDVAADLMQAVNQKGKKAIKCQRLAKEAKMKGFSGLQITALGLLVDALLEDDNHLPYVSAATWIKSYNTLRTCYDLVVENPSVVVKEEFVSALGNNRACIIGGLASLVQKLNVHLQRIAQFRDGASANYFEVIQMENRLVDLTDAVLGYYQQRRRGKLMCCKILIDILGPRRQKAHDILFEKMNSLKHTVVTRSVVDTVRLLYSEILLIGDDESKCRALLHLAYQLGLEGQYREGRDLVLRSGVEETVEKSVHLSILYNRVIAQLGLASFSAGDVFQAYNLLSPLWSNRNHEVLISQRMPDYVKDAAEKELKFRDLLVPPHAYIQHSQVELATMLSTLIVDTTKEAKKPYEESRHQSYFYRILNQMSHQFLLGEPVEFKEQVASAYAALKVGDYAQASKIVQNMEAWTAMPNGDDTLRAFLQHLKEAALRVFCYNNRCNFATISVEILMKRYELTENEVKCVINDIISENNSPLIAFWEREDKYLHVDRNNASRLQYLVEGTAESVVDVAQYSEKRVRENDFRGGRGRGRGRGRGGR